MHGHGKSDGSISSKKPSNKDPAAAGSAEEVEGRGPPKGNSSKRPSYRTLGRGELPVALPRVRSAARRDKGLRFTSLWHHVYNPWLLEEAYFGLKRTAAAGVDGETWRSYGEDLRAKLLDLASRLQRGAYRAKPVARSYVPKSDGGQRPIGIPVLEDKIVQSATVKVLNSIYEEDFVGFSYGSRRGRSPHDALDALSVAIQQRKVNWVLDADIRGYYDAINHGWMMKFVEHRVAEVDPAAPHRAPVSLATPTRHHLREEPSMGKLCAGICAGGAP